MRSKIQQRYIAILIIPFLLVICLASWLTYYAYRRGAQVMRQDVEKSSLRVAESMSDNVDTLLGQIQQSATNLAIQITKVNTIKSSQLSMYRSTIDQLTHLQLNAESLLNPIVKKGYVFLFDENRAISQSSTVHVAQDLYDRYFRVYNDTYQAFKTQFTGQYYAGSVLANATVGFIDETYHAWMVAQTIPADPFLSPIGVILYTLDISALSGRIGDALADDDSLCMMLDPSGAYVMRQGAGRAWDEAASLSLVSAVRDLPIGAHYITTEDGVEHLACIALGKEGIRIVTAQPVANALRGLQTYTTLMVVLAIGMMVLALSIVLVFTRRNVVSVQDVLSSIAPQDRVGNAKDVFEYIRSAVLSMQQSNAQLSTHADRQRALLRSIFLRRFMRGEFALESDFIREQHVAGLAIDAPCYVVLLVHGLKPDTVYTPYQEIERVVKLEFENAHVVDMGTKDTACLLPLEEPTLRESVEAVAQALAQVLEARLYASGMAMDVMDIPRAYREVRTMASIAPEGAATLLWYGDMYRDDVLYNYEYNLYTETKLRNTIATGDGEETCAVLNALYENSVKGSGRSPRVLRFFAYDLYRLVNHIDTAAEHDGARDVFLKKIQGMLDSVIDAPDGFDQYFAEIQAFCLKVCELNKNNRRSNNNELRERTLAYIEAHFTDPELNVSSIAREFGISDKYLSQFFKEQTNERISGYIEGKRIAHACRLMDATDLSINEVSLASGYAHTHTFRAAFKKVQGITPTQYKESGGMRS